MTAPTQAAAEPVFASRGTGRLAHPSVGAATARRVAAGAIVPMVAVTAWLALTSRHLEHPAGSALYWSYLVAASMAVGLYWWPRRPASRFGPLLVVFGLLAWVVSWESSNAPLAYDIAVLAEAPAYWLTFYLFLAFPTGRLEPAGARWLMAALAVAIGAFYLPWALFSPVLGGHGPLTHCVPGCPANVLQLASAPGLVEVTRRAATYADLAIIVAVLFVYVARVRTASPPQRRALMAVAATSLVFLPARFLFSVQASVAHPDAQILAALTWGLVGARVLLPLGFLVALVRAERFATRALRRLLERLAGRTAEQWQEEVGAALDDPELRLGYYEPSSGRFRDAEGCEVAPPPAGSGRVWVPIERGRRPVAALVIDESLAEDPELVRAATSATLLAVETGALEGELRDSRARLLEAGDAERQRIERDLHDSAQQRLVALRIHLALAGEQLDRTEDQEMLERLGAEVEHAIQDLRDVARGIYPALLASRGAGAALADLARRSPIPVSIRDGWRHRHTEAVETTVYFCVAECLQNAAKHAGPGTSAVVRLSERPGRVGFCVTDDGAGFDPGAAGGGIGLANLADRVAAVGGTLDVNSGRGRGTRIAGDIPVAEAQPIPAALHAVT